MTGRHRPEHGRSQHNLYALTRKDDPAAGDVGVLLQKDRILRAAAARQNRIDAVSMST